MQWELKRLTVLQFKVYLEEKSIFTKTRRGAFPTLSFLLNPQKLGRVFQKLGRMF